MIAVIHGGASSIYTTPRHQPSRRDEQDYGMTGSLLSLSSATETGE